MIDDVDIIPLADRERWTRAQQSDGLPGQAWSYAHALQASGIEPQLAVVRAGGARMLLPFFERSWHGHRDIATLLGLSGASVNPASAAPIALWSAFATARGWVAGYLHFGNDLPTVPATLASVLATNTVYELDLTRDDPFAAASAIVRRKLRKADAAGAELVDTPEELEVALPRLYREAAWRQGASSAYALPDKTLRRWVRAPDILALGVRVGGAIEAISLFPFAGAHAEYHINASSEAGRSFSTWLIGEAVGRLRQRGVAWLNIGGGLEAGDPLDHYKARFQGQPRQVHTVGQIYDQRRYAALCEQASADPRVAGWFPAYARPTG
ncbi:MAG: GNAT family N-acetyltransferase [Luteimonas sp.]